MFIFQEIVPLPEVGQKDIANTNAVPAGFIHIGWTDTLKCRSNFFLALDILRCSVELPVRWKN